MIEFYEEKDGFGEYQRVYHLGDHKVYRFEDLHKLEKVIETARKMWREASAAYMKKEGDVGSCVLGNGLAVAVKPPKKRNIYKLLIATPVGQSESPGWHTMQPVIDYLKANGLDVWYECGRMD